MDTNTNDTPDMTDPSDAQLEAYALGALDAADRATVERLLAQSPERRAALRQLREVVALLPYAAAPADPPARVRERLFARIAASRPAPAVDRPRAAAPRRSWLMPAVVAALTVLLLALAGLTVSLGQSVAALDRSNRRLVDTLGEMQQILAQTRSRQGRLEAQLEADRQELDSLNARLLQDQYVVSFVSAPGVATRDLAAAAGELAARGEMYMYPGEASAVVFFSGLPALEPGKVYQFWLADANSQVAAGTFAVDETGIASLIVEAPREVNAFRQVMVTVEPAGGSARPSQEVVLQGSL